MLPITIVKLYSWVGCKTEEITVDVVGQLCTPLDCIGKKIKIPKPEVGDLLVIPNVGAYGMTASVCSFLSRPAPAPA